MATGIDNSGLYEGKREAMGIIKTLASEVTSFDIFSGIGISAATAFAQAAKSSYDFEKEFRKNMLEVATISTQVTDDMTGFMNQVMSSLRNSNSDSAGDVSHLHYTRGRYSERADLCSDQDHTERILDGRLSCLGVWI